MKGPKVDLRTFKQAAGEEGGTKERGCGASRGPFHSFCKHSLSQAEGRIKAGGEDGSQGGPRAREQAEEGGGQEWVGAPWVGCAGSAAWAPCANSQHMTSLAPRGGQVA